LNDVPLSPKKNCEVMERLIFPCSWSLSSKFSHFCIAEVQPEAEIRRVFEESGRWSDEEMAVDDVEIETAE
jgi:hypothetical protein